MTSENPIDPIDAARQAPPEPGGGAPEAPAAPGGGTPEAPAEAVAAADAVPAAPGAEAQAPGGEAGAGKPAKRQRQGRKGAKARKGRKGRIALVSLGAAFVLVAGGGGGVYATQHSNPSFCNAICHTPMDPYVESFKEGTSTNALQTELTGPLSVTIHKDSDQGIVCLTCHDDGIGEQLREGWHWVTGSYSYPLEGITLTAKEPKVEGERSGVEFCLREGCHVGVETLEELKDVLSDQKRNPHDSHNGTLDCTECHRTHEQSVLWCTQCHADAQLPEGWLSYADQQKQIKEAAGE
ncbi:MAG: cytochrome c3 family protein [Bifidobacteriaceae bacterium]|jgi:hypothetical protein|nr:cytochrome c3 family protein [Bifidobacteriaceae bacterium]